jgi:ubiquinone/menaquinone biosynthesis C-methylase UbiE
MSYRSELEKAVHIEKIRISRYQEFMEVIKKNIQGNCIDIGCGTGLRMKFFIPRVDRLIGIDISETRIKEAKKMHPEINFIISDARKLPFKNQIFDTVLALEVIEHLPNYYDQEVFLQEVKRVLKPGGKFIISTPNSPIFKLYCIFAREYYPTHFSELNYFQFKYCLKKYFGNVKIYGQFGWLSPLYGFKTIRIIHGYLSRLTPLCKGLLAVCKK